MAGLWAALLIFGGWAAPGIAASGNPENVDPRDEAASDANGAALRYLRYGSNEDPDRAEAALCEGASPELTPADLDAIRNTYSDDFGGITDIDLDLGDPVVTSDGISIASTVFYIYQGNQDSEDFIVTVQEDDGTYCVSNATQAEEPEPSSDAGTGETVDPKALTTDFMRATVVDRDPTAAASFECTSYTGTTPQDVDAAITDWAEANGETTPFLNGINRVESSETSITTYEVEVSLKAGLNEESFIFFVGVQDDCVASLTGGDGLL